MQTALVLVLADKTVHRLYILGPCDRAAVFYRATVYTSNWLIHRRTGNLRVNLATRNRAEICPCQPIHIGTILDFRHLRRDFHRKVPDDRVFVKGNKKAIRFHAIQPRLDSPNGKALPIQRSIEVVNRLETIVYHNSTGQHEISRRILSQKLQIICVPQLNWGILSRLGWLRRLDLY